MYWLLLNYTSRYEFFGRLFVSLYTKRTTSYAIFCLSVIHSHLIILVFIDMKIAIPETTSHTKLPTLAISSSLALSITDLPFFQNFQLYMNSEIGVCNYISASSATDKPIWKIKASPNCLNYGDFNLSISTWIILHLEVLQEEFCQQIILLLNFEQVKFSHTYVYNSKI